MAQRLLTLQGCSVVSAREEAQSFDAVPRIGGAGRPRRLFQNGTQLHGFDVAVAKQQVGRFQVASDNGPLKNIGAGIVNGVRSDAGINGRWGCIVVLPRELVHTVAFDR